jgi:hypothetical protein
MSFARTAMTLSSALLLSSLGAFASTNNCPGNSTTGPTPGSVTSTLSGGPTYSGISIPGASTTNNLASLGSAGCTAIDLSFSNFTQTSSGTNENSLPSAGGTYVSITPAGTVATTPDTLLFSTIQGDASGADGALNDGVLNTKVDGTESFTSTMSYGVTNSAPTGIYAVVLSVNAITLAAGGSGTVTIDTCLQGNGVDQPTGNITNAVECKIAAGGGMGAGIFQTSTITLAQLVSQSTTIALATNSTYADITQVIKLSCTSCGSNETGFLTFSDQFDESPEPSTFILIGTGLGAAALVRFRRRKKT